MRRCGNVAAEKPVVAEALAEAVLQIAVDMPRSENYRRAQRSKMKLSFIKIGAERQVW